MAAAVPFAIKAGSMIGGSLLGKALSGPSKEQKAATQGTLQAGQQVGNAAQPLLQTGANLTQQGSGYLGKAGDYYSNILSNRKAANESLAPEQTTALNYYQGAGNKIQRTMRGGSRDYAQAELDRQKVGQFAGMLPAARARAAEGAAGVGSAALGAGSAASGQGANAATSAAYINSGLFNQADRVRQQQAEGGKQWGGLLYDVAQMLPWGKKQPATGGGVPSMPWTLAGGTS